VEAGGRVDRGRRGGRRPGRRNLRRRPERGKVVYACVFDDLTGPNTRIVAEADLPCPARSVLRSWSIQGPPGAPGPKGATGLKGPAGPKGPTVATGPKGPKDLGVAYGASKSRSSPPLWTLRRWVPTGTWRGRVRTAAPALEGRRQGAADLLQPEQPTQRRTQPADHGDRGRRLSRAGRLIAGYSGVRTSTSPSGRPSRARSAIPRNRPCSTTPATCFSVRSRRAGSASSASAQSRM
jgi:hypothetical protein